MARPPPPLDVTPEQWGVVREILERHTPGRPVWGFGSRAKGRAKPYSDLDLAIISETPLPLSTQAALSEAFSESDLPWRVDVVDWATTSETFRAIIARDRVVLLEGASG